MRWAAAATLACFAVAGLHVRAQDWEVGSGAPSAAPVLLVNTVHPPVPGKAQDFWFVPERTRSSAAARTESAGDRFARAAKLIEDGSYASALPLISNGDLDASPLSSYAQYYRAIALIGLNRFQEAADVLETLAARSPDGYLQELVPLRLAEVSLSLQNARHAVSILDDLRKNKAVTSPEDVWLRLGRAAEAAGDRDKAIEAYRKVYYEYAASQQANEAQDLLARLDTTSLSDRFKLELARAERLFTLRRYAQARAGFTPLAALASGDDKELIAIRLAECDYYLDRFLASRDALTPFLTGSSRAAEARFFYLTATRALGDVEAYLAQAHALIADQPDSTWALETLNNLASHYIIVDDDAAADAAFRELFRRFPESRYGERAAWKIGWWAYKNDQFADAAQAFEAGAARFPRADFRPAWLYWAGRAHDQIGETAIANDRYRLEVADYQNSYYGRLAAKILQTRDAQPVPNNVTIGVNPAAPRLPTEGLIRELVRLELYDQATKELQYAQGAWGNIPAIDATIAWIRHDQAQHETAPERFNDLRGAINIMKRAYPQYLAAGGEGLPPEVLEIIYPMDYWPLIKKYSDANRLDPYLMAALIAQESTFTADVRSSANAYGLMQLIPATGRRYAQRLRLGPFSTSSLTRPETNIRLGMAYFSDLVERFGSAHYALASYNAGESRVAQWMTERPDADQDEFIDDIPFPETQNYVKRILGTADDYRRLYGEGLLQPGVHSTPPVKATATKVLPPAAPKTTAPKAKAPAKKKAPVKKAPPKRTTRAKR